MRFLRTEMLPALGLILLLVYFTTEPHLLAWSIAPPGTVHLGNFRGLNGDEPTYVCWVEQARRGAFLFRNCFTPEPHEPCLVNLLWWITGQICRVFDLSAPVGIELARIGGTLASGLAAWVLIRRLTETSLARLASLAIVLLSGGLGWIPFLRQGDVRIHWLPIDMYIAESTPFASCISYAHFAWAQALLWGGFAAMARALAEARMRSAICAALLFFCLGWFHPYDLLTALAVAGGYGICRQAWRPHLRGPWAVILVGILIPLVVQTVLFSLVPILRAWREQNILSPPHPTTLLMGWGVIVPLALTALIRPRTRLLRDRALLWIWAAAGLLLLYLPGIRFNIHLVLGLRLPIAVLAVGGVLALLPADWRVRGLAVTAIWACGAWTCVLWYLSHVELVTRGTLPQFVPSALVQLIREAENVIPPQAVTLVDDSVAGLVPALALRPVVWGHNHLTVRQEERLALVRAVFDRRAALPPAVAETLRNLGVRFVLCRNAKQVEGVQRIGWRLRRILNHGPFALFAVEDHLLP